MLAVEKWMQGMHPVLAVFGIQLVSGLDGYAEIFHKIKNPNSFPHISIPPLKTWLRFYRHESSVYPSLRKLITEFSAFGQEGTNHSQSIVSGAKQIKSLGTETVREMLDAPRPEELAAIQDEINKQNEALLAAALKDLKSEIDPSPNADNSALVSLLASSPALTFFFLVFFPCWLLYRDTPARLYRKAKGGDMETLDKLLRLDSALIHDPSISQVLYGLREKRKFHHYETLLAACLKSPKAKITEQKIKVTTAGLLSYFFDKLGQPLTEPRIRALFDALAQDRSKGEILTDSDLPISSESFSKAIQRERAMWQGLIPPDKR